MTRRDWLKGFILIVLLAAIYSAFSGKIIAAIGCTTIALLFVWLVRVMK